MPEQTILLADDEAHITCVVSHKLRAAGFSVVTARDGEEAFELACRATPSLIITDLQMPRMSGLELALKLRETPATSRTPLIMLTARGYILDSRDVALTNIRCLVSKPFSARELVRRVVDELATGAAPGTGQDLREAA